MTVHQPHQDPVESWQLSPPKKSKKTRRSQKNCDNPKYATVEALDTLEIIPTALLFSMPGSVRLLVCSIGNPGQYINTLHSAGHTVLNALASNLSYPSFAKSKLHGNGLLSQGSDLTLWQSSSLMNISGVGVATAYKQFIKELRGEEGRLVVVHDELELALGQVNVKDGSASPKGHNGLKSIKEQLRGTPWTRIGVGIGRPTSREPDVVASFVLRKMSGVEKARIEGSVGAVEMELRKLAG